ncbi:nucleotidyltransferase domain-containing protein [archaeon]|nr:nucleotidyltransferase domain-containing protein [archaeon]
MNKIKKLFFCNTLRRWHFEEIVRESGMSRERVNHYLKQLVKKGFIIRAKPKGKMPYYIAQRESEIFRLEKRFYGLNTLQKSGLFEHLNSLRNVKSIVLFGSFARGDWDKSSDIDLFIFGDAGDFDKEKFEIKLEREIQLFSYKDRKLIKKELDPKLIPNIYKGFNIKGSIEPFEVKING